MGRERGMGHPCHPRKEQWGGPLTDVREPACVSVCGKSVGGGCLCVCVCLSVCVRSGLYVSVSLYICVSVCMRPCFVCVCMCV